MLVGHLPHLSRLVSRLLGLDADRTVVQFRMGGVTRLERDASGAWVVRWVLPPDLVGPAAG
jgi:phosphohistidine phosphatase